MDVKKEVLLPKQDHNDAEKRRVHHIAAQISSWNLFRNIIVNVNTKSRKIGENVAPFPSW